MVGGERRNEGVPRVFLTAADASEPKVFTTSPALIGPLRKTVQKYHHRHSFLKYLSKYQQEK